MIRFIIACALVTLAPCVATAHDGDEIHNRIGLRSEAVIRNDLRQLGMTARSVQMQGGVARVEVTLEGRQAILEVDRLGGGLRMLEAPPEISSALAKKLRPSAVVRPEPAVIPTTPARPVTPPRPIGPAPIQRTPQQPIQPAEPTVRPTR